MEGGIPTVLLTINNSNNPTCTTQVHILIIIIITLILITTMHRGRQSITPLMLTADQEVIRLSLVLPSSLPIPIQNMIPKPA